MLMQTQSYSIEDLFEKTGKYLETRADLFRYKAIDKSSDVISSLAANIFVILILLIFVLTINIGVALWIGDLLGKNFYGFFIVAGFYAIVGLVLFLYRNKWIKVPVSRLIIDKVST
jgi:hypothetical protein